MGQHVGQKKAGQSEQDSALPCLVTPVPPGTTRAHHAVPRQGTNNSQAEASQGSDNALGGTPIAAPSATGGSHATALASGVAESKPYADVMAILKSRMNVEATPPHTLDAAKAFSLERISQVLARLRNPHLDLRVVHVAGSKGKGSVSNPAAAVRACGCTVGLFTSPHITDLRERIRVDGAMIGEGDLARVVDEVIVAEKAALKGKEQLTQFELLTAAAFVHFRRQAVDVAVIEVGLGGAGDATNVVKPVVCVVTSIQREHTQILGDTLPEIAAHKAGIIKDGVPTLTLPQTNEVMRVLRQRCGEVEAPLDVLDHSIPYAHRYQTGADGIVRMMVTVECDGTKLEGCPCPSRASIRPSTPAWPWPRPCVPCPRASRYVPGRLLVPWPAFIRTAGWRSSRPARSCWPMAHTRPIRSAPHCERSPRTFASNRSRWSSAARRIKTFTPCCANLPRAPTG